MQASAAEIDAAASILRPDSALLRPPYGAFDQTTLDLLRERGQAIDALPRIVHALRDRGYTLVSVPQLLRDAPPSLTQPKLGVGVG